jgi:cysteinyl-tRNA synthetase
VSFSSHNTLTRRKEPFRSLEPGVVRMYNCGPTVYNRQHIGNFRAFLFADLLRRWLEYRATRCAMVMNITDVGHLTDDVLGEGDDKIEARARKEGLDPWKISRETPRPSLSDLARLGVRKALIYPRATDHIGEMLEMIDGLIAKGCAYVVGGDVYFDVTRFDRYGRLSGNRLGELEAGARIAVREEKAQPGGLRPVEERSGPHHEVGDALRARRLPGLAHRVLGDGAQAPGGPARHPHRRRGQHLPRTTSARSRSRSFTGKPFATYWMHTKFLQVDGGKMSKRLGNVYSIDDVEARLQPRANCASR